MKFLLFARRLLGQDISTFSTSLFLCATLGLLAGCGGGSGPNVPTAPGAGGGGVAGTSNSLQLLVSSPQIASSGATTVTLTAIVVGPGGQTVSGQTVTFATNEPPGSGAFINNISAGGVSDANGIVTAVLNLGTNRANRTITVTASAAGATATNTVDVTGTAITITGNNSLALGAGTALTFTVANSAGTGLSGIPVSITSQNGNTVTPSSGVTNAQGRITVTVTGVVAGTDVIMATGGGAAATLNLTVSSASFVFTTPASAAEIPLSTATPISVAWTNAAGAPVVGMPVTFTASRGTVTGSPAVTNGAGVATASISSTSAGAAIITASGPAGTPAATLNIEFVATTASSVTVQAVPGTIQVTTGAAGQTNNSSTISVIVRDAANNLVKNANVNFSIVSDPTGGRLTASSGTTDTNGTTSVTYVGGAISSAQNGVVISATVTAVRGVPVAPITSATSLTVSGQSLLVRLGTDNEINNSAPPIHRKTYAAIVTDASGNAVPGAVVRFALRPGRYRKGFFFVDPGDPTAVPPRPAPSTWQQAVTVECPNEDVNFDGIVQPGEDTNGNGSLEPGGVANVNASGTTDANGIATAILVYPENYSLWAEVTLEARTGVVGNDPPTRATFFLPGAVTDYQNLSVPPPGQTSPFGSNGSCAVPG